MFHRTAAYYRDYEDKKAAQVIGDQYECTRLYTPSYFQKIAPDGTPGAKQPFPNGQRMECITGLTGFTTVGPGGFSQQITESFTISENLTKVMGQHSFKMGWEMVRSRENPCAGSWTIIRTICSARRWHRTTVSRCW